MSKKNNYKVYVHINKINGKRYFGITKQEVEKRWLNGKGYNKNKYFTNAINKYGWNNFEHIVIAKGLTEEEAKWLEIELIREWNTTNRDKGYNITLGGEGGNGYKHTEEARKKISEAGKGKTHTEEHRKKISEANKGHGVTKETREKISETLKGQTLSEETRKKISKNNAKYWYSKTLSEEHRKKLSEARKGKYEGKNNPSATKVYCVELEQYFDTVKEASEFVGCNKSNISQALKGKRKIACGYHWLYAEDVNEENINRVLSEEYNTNNGKPTRVYCVELEQYFDTVTEASEFVGCSQGNISNVLSGRHKTCGGYHWIYAEDVEIENNKVS